MAGKAAPPRSWLRLRPRSWQRARTGAGSGPRRGRSPQVSLSVEFAGLLAIVVVGGWRSGRLTARAVAAAQGPPMVGSPGTTSPTPPVQVGLSECFSRWLTSLFALFISGYWMHMGHGIEARAYARLAPGDRAACAVAQHRHCSPRERRHADDAHASRRRATIRGTARARVALSGVFTVAFSGVSPVHGNNCRRRVIQRGQSGGRRLHLLTACTPSICWAACWPGRGRPRGCCAAPSSTRSGSASSCAPCTGTICFWCGLSCSPCCSHP